jgi:hypothetical protein
MDNENAAKPSSGDDRVTKNNLLTLIKSMKLSCGKTDGCRILEQYALSFGSRIIEHYIGIDGIDPSSFTLIVSGYVEGFCSRCHLPKLSNKTIVGE